MRVVHAIATKTNVNDSCRLRDMGHPFPRKVAGGIPTPRVDFLKASS
jgi:hypothetical protein